MITWQRLSMYTKIVKIQIFPNFFSTIIHKRMFSLFTEPAYIMCPSNKLSNYMFYAKTQTGFVFVVIGRKISKRIGSVQKITVN